MPHIIEVQIDETYKPQLPTQPDRLRRVVLATLEQQQIKRTGELTVVVTTDEVLHELNRRYRDVDAPTDVLAFPEQPRGPFVGAPGLPRYLGDIIISYPRAQAQAAEAGHDVSAELQLLVVHGVLHLLGHDDQSEPERSHMWGAQQTILEALGLEIELPD